MFKIAPPDATWTYPVIINVPVGAGDTEEQTFTAEFRLVSEDELAAVDKAKDEAAFLEAVLVGWDGVNDHRGKALACTPKNRARLSKIAYFAIGVASAYSRFRMGLPAKNSEPSLPAI